MKKQKIKICSIIFLTIIFSILAGCTEDQNSLDKTKIIGKWHGRYFNVTGYENITTEVEFFKNNTAKTIYYFNDSGTNNQINLDWAHYELNNGEFCYKEIGDNDSSLNCINYKFSSNYAKLSLTFKDNPEFLYELTRIE